eukprot:scaffold113646_cov22-Tisochrysis_lutea.AAC.1
MEVVVMMVATQWCFTDSCIAANYVRFEPANSLDLQVKDWLDVRFAQPGAAACRLRHYAPT